MLRPRRICSLTTEPDERTPWRLPSCIWLESWRRAWLEQAKITFREGGEEGFRESLERTVILRLFFWRGVIVLTRSPTLILTLRGLICADRERPERQGELASPREARGRGGGSRWSGSAA